MICFEDHWSSARGRSLWLSVICSSRGAADSTVCLKSSNHCSIRIYLPEKETATETESLRQGTEKENSTGRQLPFLNFLRVSTPRLCRKSLTSHSHRASARCQTL